MAGISVQAEPQRKAIGLQGQYPPILTLVDNYATNAIKTVDNDDTHGVLYPTNYDSTTQAIINTNMGILQSNFTPDDETYSNDEEKFKVIGQFVNTPKQLMNVTMMQRLFTRLDLSALVETGEDENYKWVPFVDGFLRVRIASGVVKARFVKVTGDNAATLGTEIDLNTSGGSYIVAQKMSATTAMVAWIESNTIKTIKLTVNEGANTVSKGSVNTTSITNAQTLVGICKPATGVWVIQYTLTSTSYGAAVAGTLSGGSWANGSGYTHFSRTSVGVGFAVNHAVALSATKIAFVNEEETNKLYITWVDLSGTTLSNAIESGQQTNQYLRGCYVLDGVLIIAINSSTTQTNLQLKRFEPKAATAGTQIFTNTQGGATARYCSPFLGGDSNLIFSYYSSSGSSSIQLIKLTSASAYIVGTWPMHFDNLGNNLISVLTADNCALLYPDIGSVTWVQVFTKATIDMQVNDNAALTGKTFGYAGAITMNQDLYERNNAFSVANKSGATKTLRVAEALLLAE